MIRPVHVLEALKRRRYRMVAVPGSALVMTSALWWGHGSLPYLLAFVGLGMIILPFPRDLRPDKRPAEPAPGPGGWTSTR